MIRLYNSLKRKKQPLEPLNPSTVGLYVCGPTVYDRAHLGNARSVIVFDTLFRLLRHAYGEKNVSYIRNITDVDDKINARAAQTGRSIKEITDETIDWFEADMKALGALAPSHQPRATDYISEMIAMIETLIIKKHAYVAENHVLFRVDSFADYGALSGRTLKDMIAGARVEVAPYKENPMDFILWKPSHAPQPGWESPWGIGRPGWHIECSAMSHKLLGPSFDIHGGGGDLQFPHHENELAQSRCAHPGSDFVSIWMHNAMLQIDGQKMSKSLNNFFTVRDLLDQGICGETIRFVMLSTHYRKPLDWTAEKVRAAAATLDKWRLIIAGKAMGTIDAEALDNLSEDLNTPGVIAILHKLATKGDAPTLKATARLIGLFEDETASISPRDTVDLRLYKEKLETLRADALAARDFSRLDSAKAQLQAAGISVEMHKTEIILSPRSDFDPQKLTEIFND